MGEFDRKDLRVELTSYLGVSAGKFCDNGRESMSTFLGDEGRTACGFHDVSCRGVILRRHANDMQVW
jgi:hypothetical protein